MSPRNEPGIGHEHPAARCVPPTLQDIAAQVAGFIWPVKGAILDPFGTRPDGTRIDGIAIAAGECVPVRAATAGHIAYTGSKLQGVWPLVLIEHGDGFLSVYARNRALLVAGGKRVAQGQPIAFAGVAPIQFQLRIGIKPVDPRYYLDDATIRLASAEPMTEAPGQGQVPCERTIAGIAHHLIRQPPLASPYHNDSRPDVQPAGRFVTAPAPVANGVISIATLAVDSGDMKGMPPRQSRSPAAELVVANSVVRMGAESPSVQTE